MNGKADYTTMVDIELESNINFLVDSSPVEQKSIIVRKSFQFALNIVELYRFLTSDKKEYILGKQILRSGTSVGAMVRESQNAESKADFIHKLSVAQKECDETCYWLELMFQSQIIPQQKFLELQTQAEELLRILRSIIITSKKNLNSKK